MELLTALHIDMCRSLNIPRAYQYIIAHCNVAAYSYIDFLLGAVRLSNYVITVLKTHNQCHITQSL